MISNQQREVRVAIAPIERFLDRVRKRLRLGSESVSVCLVSSPRIARWNRAYRGKNKAADVLSFPAVVRKRAMPVAPKRGNARGEYLGDIAIAPEMAKRNAVRFGRAFERELRILVLHGVLHLMGYDHEADRGQMDRIERRLRREMGLE